MVEDRWPLRGLRLQHGARPMRGVTEVARRQRGGGQHRLCRPQGRPRLRNLRHPARRLAPVRTRISRGPAGQPQLHGEPWVLEGGRGRAAPVSKRHDIHDRRLQHGCLDYDPLAPAHHLQRVGRRNRNRERDDRHRDVPGLRAGSAVLVEQLVGIRSVPRHPPRAPGGVGATAATTTEPLTQPFALA